MSDDDVNTRPIEAMSDDPDECARKALIADDSGDDDNDSENDDEDTDIGRCFVVL